MNRATGIFTFIGVIIIAFFQDALPDPRLLIILLSLPIILFILWKVSSAIYTNNARAAEAARRSRGLKELDARVQSALADGILELDEYNSLIEQAQARGLSKDDVDDIRRSVFNKEAGHLMARFKESGELSDENLEEFVRLANKRGLVVDVTPEMMAANILWRTQYRHEWTPRILNTDLMLGAGEEAYFRCPAQWAQQTVVKENLGYQGALVNLKVTSEISVGFGGAKPVFNEYETLRTLAEGTLYLSNKRLFFKSITETQTIALSEISDLEYFSDGLRVYKASGKPDVFIVADHCAASLKALLTKLIPVA